MVSKSFILLMIGVSILEVTSWPRRGFGGFGGFLLSDNPDEGQNGNKNEKVEEKKPEGGQGRFHNRNGEQGFGIPFANPAAIIPRIQAIRENFQKLPSLPAKVLLEMSKKSEDAKNESPSKNSNNLPQKTDDQKDSAANGTRRLINAPLRCQEDSAGNCREAF